MEKQLHHLLNEMKECQENLEELKKELEDEKALEILDKLISYKKEFNETIKLLKIANFKGSGSVILYFLTFLILITCSYCFPSRILLLVTNLVGFVGIGVTLGYVQAVEEKYNPLVADKEYFISEKAKEIEDVDLSYINKKLKEKYVVKRVYHEKEVSVIEYSEIEFKDYMIKINKHIEYLKEIV